MHSPPLSGIPSLLFLSIPGLLPPFDSIHSCFDLPSSFPRLIPPICPKQMSENNLSFKNTQAKKKKKKPIHPFANSISLSNTVNLCDSSGVKFIPSLKKEKKANERTRRWWSQFSWEAAQSVASFWQDDTFMFPQIPSKQPVGSAGSVLWGYVFIMMSWGLQEKNN